MHMICAEYNRRISIGEGIRALLNRGFSSATDAFLRLGEKLNVAPQPPTLVFLYEICTWRIILQNQIEILLYFNNNKTKVS